MRYGVLATTVVVLGALFSSGCGSCVQEGDQLVLELHAAPEMNDAQHVKFRAWAVKDAALFSAADAGDLVEQDVGLLMRRGLGDPIDAPFEWIAPGRSLALQVPVPADEAYTGVGVVVLYPKPERLFVPLDCKERNGYRLERPAHRIDVALGRSSVTLGSGAAQVGE